MLMHKNTHSPKSFRNRGALRKRMGISSEAPRKKESALVSA